MPEGRCPKLSLWVEESSVPAPDTTSPGPVRTSLLSTGRIRVRRPTRRRGSLIETRVGFGPFTTDRIPHIGWASSIGGLLLGLGISSQGMTMGAHTGATLADQALGMPGREIPAAFKPRV